MLYQMKQYLILLSFEKHHHNNQGAEILVKGLVHPKMKIQSVFTHPHVVPNLYVFICSAEQKGRYLEECFNQTDLIPH